MDLEQVKAFILEKSRNNAIKFGDRLPTGTKNGKYGFVESGGWVGGFWPGINFLCYELSGDEQFLTVARSSRYRLADRLYQHPESMDHDVGFLFTLSCVADYKLTGDEQAKQIALDAAKGFASRYNKTGRFIKAWNTIDENDPFSVENRGRVIIDCMYNLPLLFWAAEVTNNEEYKAIATAHAQTCGKYLVRDDFTTFHTYVFDYVTGKPKYGRTHQGYADNSCWSRGQAWAIGGFTYAYAYTKNEEFLNIAKNCAKVFIGKLEDDFVPMWDFDVPDKTKEPRDTSAAAIAAASMLELSKYVSEDERRYYYSISKSILENLYEKYSSQNLPEEEGLLLNATGHKPNNAFVDVSIIYGDYYFTEAIARLLNQTVCYW